MPREDSMRIKAQIVAVSDKLNQMDVVASVKTDGFAGMQKSEIAKAVEAEYAKFGKRVDRQNFGIILLEFSQINKALEYLYTDGEKAALLTVPRVLKRGIIADMHTEHKERGVNSITFAAPVEINGIRGNVGVVVQRVAGTNRFKTLRILLPNGKAFEFVQNKEADSTAGSSSKPKSLEGIPIESASKNSIRTEGDIVKNEFSVKKSERDPALTAKINESLTMQEARQMIQRAFVIGNIKEWYDGEYQNGDEWLAAQGAEEVALYIENEYTLQAAYLDKIPGLLDEEFFLMDVLEAYQQGTLTGKVKKKTERINIADGVAVADPRFYAPKEIENAKELYGIANQRITNGNRETVNRARAQILLYAHNKGAAETLGITQSELNKKLRTWGGYSAKARDISMRINAGAHTANRWTGIESLSWLNKATVTNEDVLRMVKVVEGNGDGFQNNYIARTMLALDTHIDWSWLTIKFDTYQGVNSGFKGNSPSGKCNGYYQNDGRLIHVKRDAPNTVAHEMGHALDYQWGRDLGYEYTCLTEITRNTKNISGEAKVWFDHFKDFSDSLVASSDLRNEYSMDIKETFARFVAKFVEWTEQLATGRTSRYETSYYQDKFTPTQFIQFARLLQEKSAIDAKGLIKNKLDAHGEAADPLSNQTLAAQPKDGTKFADRYSPETLFAKDPLTVATFPVREVPTKRKKVNLPELVKEAKKGTGTITYAVERDNPTIQRYVYISDIDSNVLVNTRGIVHGAQGNITNSSTMSTAEVEQVLPNVLRNSIAVNELSPRNEDIGKGVVKSYVLFGYAKRADGKEYLVRSTINHFGVNKSMAESITIYDVLKGTKAKKWTPK